MTVQELWNLRAAASRAYQRARYWIDLRTRYRNDRFRQRGAPDGLPLPSPRMVYLVTGQHDLEVFFQNGLVGARCIEGILESQGLDLRAFESILDFGCGCGRVMRHWKGRTTSKLHGTDYHAALVDWCRRSLPFAEFKRNGLGSRLDYPDGRFGFIYAISVFTHLSEPSQAFWIDELSRVLAPGGFLLLTTHGTTRVHQLTHDERRSFDAGRLVVRQERWSGQNACTVFHPEPYVRLTLARGLSVVAFAPGAARDAGQDGFLLQKPCLG